MLKKISATAFWMAVFIAIVAIQVTSAFSQSASVAGEWSNGSVGMIQYQNKVTGATKPGRGSVFTYRFLENGSYEFVGYMESTMYNCTTTLFNQINGKYRVEGSTIFLSPAKDLWKNGNTCAPSSSKQQLKTPVKKELQFDLRTDEQGKRLLCIVDGESETCYRREEN